MIFRLVSLKKRNFIARFFNYYNYIAKVEYSNRMCKLYICISKEMSTNDIMRRIKWKLSDIVAAQTFDSSMAAVKSQEGHVVSVE